MRKLLILLSVLLIDISVTLAQPSLSTTTFSVANENLPPIASTFNVPINVAGFPSNLRYIEVVLNYDNTILSYSAVVNLQHPGFPIVITTTTPGQIKVNYNNFVTPFNVTDGKLFDIQFVYSGGDSPLTFNSACKYRVGSTITPITVFTHGAVDGDYVSNTISTGSWATAGGWSLGVVPNAFHNVTVSTDFSGVTIGAAATCNNVTVASGGKLTLNSGVTLTAGGNLTVQSGGSFIPAGTLAVTGTKSVEREITAANWATPGQGYHILSSPVVDQALNGSADFAPTGGGNDYDFYAWDEPTQTWFNQKNPAHTAMFVTFDEGKGYLAAYQMTDTKVFSGTFNTTDITKSGLTRGGYSGAGWHMLGNPFQSALIWGGAEWAYSNIAANAKVWNSAGGAYLDIAPTAKIPACNGFMVEATSNGASLTIPIAKRDHGTTTWYKSTELSIKLIAHDLDNGLAQESNINFNESATEGYESEFDSHFLEGYAPLFYSMAGGERVSTNTLPSLELNNAIPFSFVKNEGVNFSIELVEGIESNLVFIRDLKTGLTFNLSENGSYAFSAQTGDVAERFEIFFGVTGIDSHNALTAAHVYSAKNLLYVTNVKGNTTMDILNLQGQVLNSYSFDSSGSEEFVVNLPAGIYMVRLNNSNTTKTVKVFIN